MERRESTRGQCESITPTGDTLGKLGNIVMNSKDNMDKVLPYDEIRAAVFYPNRKDIISTDTLCCELAVTVASDQIS